MSELTSRYIPIRRLPIGVAAVLYSELGLPVDTPGTPTFIAKGTMRLTFDTRPKGGTPFTKSASLETGGLTPTSMATFSFAISLTRPVASSRHGTTDPIKTRSRTTQLATYAETVYQISGESTTNTSTAA